MSIYTVNEKSLIVPEMPIWRLTVDQYHEMIRAGILTEDDQIELLEGLLVTKMTKNPPHSLATQILRDLFAQRIPSDYFVSDQEPFTTEDSEPEPDVMIVRGKRRDFIEHHPRSSDILLVIEVSDSTLQRDRTAKLRIYAAAKIPQYWILNLQERQLEVYTQATSIHNSASYAQKVIYQASDTLAIALEGDSLGSFLISDILA